jgi:hypothetical protein
MRKFFVQILAIIGTCNLPYPHWWLDVDGYMAHQGVPNLVIFACSVFYVLALSDAIRWMNGSETLFSYFRAAREE